MDGLIFNIQRFSLHDGPGIRTTVFFKGCNLRCSWCHNPESQHLDQELQYFADRCLMCGQCQAVCTQGVHRVADGCHTLQREWCLACGKCAAACCTEALVMCGEKRTAEDVMAVVLRDLAFYRQSEGGMTLSGGEPLLQPEFAAHLLRIAREHGIHTAVDTAGHVPWSSIEAVRPWTDLWLYDLKGMDPQTHEQMTGVDNRQILDNLMRLGQLETPVHVRMPLISGINDQLPEIRQAACFLKQLPALAWIELAPYHALADGKYTSLARPVPVFVTPATDHIQTIMDLFQAEGLPVRLLNA